MELRQEEKLSEKEIYRGKIVRLHVDEVRVQNGNTATREVVDHPGGVGIIAINERNEICLVRQFRYPYNEFIWEIPAGKRDPGEAPQTTATRELREETGYTAENLSYLGAVYPSPGFLTEVIHLYAATGLIPGETNPDEDEFLEIRFFNAETVLDMVMSNQIKDAKTIIAVLKVLQNQSSNIVK